MSSFRTHNRRAWDDRVRRRQNHTQPAGEEMFQEQAAMTDVHGWVGRDLRGKRVLCVGAGGGRHGPLYAAAGARVTVVDLSPAMLELDRELAAKRHLQLQTIETSMDDLSMLPADAFDLIVQPVSSCYLPEVTAIYRQVARVAAAGSLYISQHKQPTNLQSDALPVKDGYLVREPYHRSGPLPPVPEGSLHREPGCMEFLHRWEDLLGGLCRSGFVIEDLIEPRHADLAAPVGSFGHRSSFIPPYVTIKARRTGERQAAAPEVRLWTR